MSLPKHYDTLLTDIGTLLLAGKTQAVKQVNSTLVQTNWNIGKRIVVFEQQGNEKAAYGSELLKFLSKELKAKYGKGFSKSNLYMMRQLYLRYPKIQTLSGKLTWSHYTELLRVSNPLVFGFCHKNMIDYHRVATQNIGQHLKILYR